MYVLILCRFAGTGRGDICHLLGINGIAIGLPSRVTGTHQGKEFPGLQLMKQHMHMIDQVDENPPTD